MKKFAKGAALALVLVCMAFAMTGCAGAGKYVYTNDTLKTEITYNLKVGGKFEATTKVGNTTTTTKGKWKKDGDTITFTSEDGKNSVEGTLKGKTLTVGMYTLTKK